MHASIRIAAAATLIALPALPSLLIAASDGLPPVIDAQTGEDAISSPAMAGSAARGGEQGQQSAVEMFRRLQVLQEEVQALRGQLEEQTHEIENLRQRQRDLYVDIDRRLRDVEGSGAPGNAGAPAAGPAPAAPAAAGGGGTGAGVGNAQEQVAYEQAFDLLKGRNYDGAITGFRKYLGDYPDGGFRDNAQYWIGEATYVLRRYPSAIDEFKKVEQLYPQSSKVPDALVKIGFSYYELQDWAKARQTLERLVQRYPDSTAARLAQQRLQKMTQEGH